MKLQDRIAATVRQSAVYPLMTLPVVLGSATTVATLLSPTPTLNSRSVRLEHVPRPEGQQIATSA
jgi:hypothetical protein